VHAKNAREIENVNLIMPGDIIRFNSVIDHAIIITKVEKDTNLKLKKAYYAHSVLEDDGEGIKEGYIDIDTGKWFENPNTGHTIDEKGKPKFYRLFIIERWLNK
jgi:hypothetical protein